MERPNKDVELLIKHLTGKKRLVPKQSTRVKGLLYNIDATTEHPESILKGLDAYFQGTKRVEKEIDTVKTWVYEGSRRR